MSFNNPPPPESNADISSGIKRRKGDEGRTIKVENKTPAITKEIVNTQKKASHISLPEAEWKAIITQVKAEFLMRNPQSERSFLLNIPKQDEEYHKI